LAAKHSAAVDREKALKLKMARVETAPFFERKNRGLKII
jgi:hypothetical protein